MNKLKDMAIFFMIAITFALTNWFSTQVLGLEEIEKHEILVFIVFTFFYYKISKIEEKL